MKNEKIKENVIIDFKKMVFNSWTFDRMTPEERQKLFETFDNIQTEKALKGTYTQRWQILQAIFTSFLNGLGYNGFNWREKEDTPKF